MEVTGHEIGTVRKVLPNLLHTGPAISLVGFMGPSDIHLFGLLKKCMAGKQFGTHVNMKQKSPLNYRHLTQIYSTLWNMRGATMEQMVKCQWRLHWSLVCTICYPCEFRIKFLTSECLLPHFPKLLLTFTQPGIMTCKEDTGTHQQMNVDSVSNHNHNYKAAIS